jgi:hypothetical protein
MNRRPAWIALSALLALTSAAAAQSKVWSGRLGQAYTDEIRGFTVRPPAEAERVTESSERRLVAWVLREEKTQAIRWTLEVLRIRTDPEMDKLPTEKFAKQVADEMARSKRFKANSTRTGKVAGRPAMHFRGVWSGALKLWQRQTWVRTGEGTHLVLSLSGQLTEGKQLDRLMDAVVGSLRLFDPAEARKRRKDQLQAGQALLDELTGDKLRAKVLSEPLYYIIHSGGKVTGFIRVKESVDHREGKIGLRVVRLAGRKTDDGTVLTHEDLFAAADGGFDQWRRIERMGDRASLEEGLRQKELLLVHRQSQGSPRATKQRKLAPVIRGAYLPPAMEMMVLRLILGKGERRAYGFAVYNPIKTDFDMRTVTLVGPDAVRLGGSKRQATRLTDQMAQDAPTADVWVDKHGRMLKMAAPRRTSVLLTSRQEVLKRFAEELQAAGRLPTWVKDTAPHRPLR